MNNPSLQQALTDDELDELSYFLETIGSPIANIEMLDGYLAALVCCPDLVLPSEYLPQILGEDFIFDTQAQATEILGLIARHWNTIACALLHTLDESGLYLPVLLTDDSGVAHGNDWALGFVRGIHTRPVSWEDLLTDDKYSLPMLPIVFLAHENDPDPAMRPPPVAEGKRNELIQLMIASLAMIYRFFEPHRRSRAQEPLHRKKTKIGRNEPCPCGSGRKFKHCCAIDSTTVH